MELGRLKRGPKQQADEVDSKALEGLWRGELVRDIRTVCEGSERCGPAGCLKVVRTGYVIYNHRAARGSSLGVPFDVSLS